MCIFHSFFYLLPPTLFYVDRCMSGLKIVNDMMREQVQKLNLPKLKNIMLSCYLKSYIVQSLLVILINFCEFFFSITK